MIVIVQDNLNTHSPASFYEIFEPEEACRLANRFEFHHTPKHGSWLNMAEIELSVLSRQCLDGFIPDLTVLAQEPRPGKPNATPMVQLLIGVSRPTMHA